MCIGYVRCLVVLHCDTGDDLVGYIMGTEIDIVMCLVTRHGIYVSNWIY